MIALACDHGGFSLMRAVREYLDTLGLPYRDFGTNSHDSCDYPVIAAPAARAVAAGECARGIFICGTGIGISIAANKIAGIRAALCCDSYTAEMSRAHNDANVLCLGARVTGEGSALKIGETFLNTEFEGGRHERRVRLLMEL